MSDRAAHMRGAPGCRDLPAVDGQHQTCTCPLDAEAGRRDERAAVEGSVWLAPHHLIDTAQSLTCLRCGQHTSLAPPCIPGRWAQLTPIEPDNTTTTPARDGLAEEVVAVLDAIKAVREQAAEERVAMHERGEPLTDRSGGVLDGIDHAMLAAKKAAYRPGDRREVTSVEEWWACEDAYQTGRAEALTDVAMLWEECGCRPVCWHKVAAKELRRLRALLAEDAATEESP